MRIRERFTQVKTVVVKVAGFVKRRWRASIAVTAGLLIIGPLLTGDGGGAFFLNAVGPGIGLIALRGFMPRPRVGKLRR